jgi:tape measure domain-containing protein
MSANHRVQIVIDASNLSDPAFQQVTQALGTIGQQAQSAGRMTQQAGQQINQAGQQSAAGFLASKTQALAFGAAAGVAQAATQTLLRGLTSIPATLFDVGRGFISMNADMEQTLVGLTSLTGSADKAAKLMDDLKRAAAATPFELPELANATRLLLAYRFEIEEIIPMLTTLGDTVASMGGGAAEIDRITRALGQMQAKGKVMAGEMLQLSELGINGYAILAEQLGITTEEVQKLGEQGKLVASEAIPMLLRGMEQAFGGGMAAQAKTFNGLMSTLRDNVNLAGMALAQPFFERFKMGLERLVQYTQTVEFGDKVQQWAESSERAAESFAGWIRDNGPGMLNFLRDLGNAFASLPDNPVVKLTIEIIQTGIDLGSGGPRTVDDYIQQQVREVNGREYVFEPELIVAPKVKTGGSGLSQEDRIGKLGSLDDWFRSWWAGAKSDMQDTRDQARLLEEAAADFQNITGAHVRAIENLGNAHPLADELGKQLVLYREWRREIEQFAAQEHYVSQIVGESGEPWRMAVAGVTDYIDTLDRLRLMGSDAANEQRKQRGAIEQHLDTLLGGSEAMGAYAEAQNRAAIMARYHADETWRQNMETLDYVSTLDAAGQAAYRASEAAARLALTQDNLASAYQVGLRIQADYNQQYGEYAGQLSNIDRAMEIIAKKQENNIALTEREQWMLDNADAARGRYTGGMQDAALTAGDYAIQNAKLMQIQDDIQRQFPNLVKGSAEYNEKLRDAAISAGVGQEAIDGMQNSNSTLAGVIADSLIPALDRLIERILGLDGKTATARVNVEFRTTGDGLAIAAVQGGGLGTQNVGLTSHALGGRFTQPHVGLFAEEPGHPEYVLPTNPAYRTRALDLWVQAGRELGVLAYAQGGVAGSSSGGAAGGGISISVGADGAINWSWLFEGIDKEAKDAGKRMDDEVVRWLEGWREIATGAAGERVRKAVGNLIAMRDIADKTGAGEGVIEIIDQQIRAQQAEAEAIGVLLGQLMVTGLQEQLARADLIDTWRKTMSSMDLRGIWSGDVQRKLMDDMIATRTKRDIAASLGLTELADEMQAAYDALSAEAQRVLAIAGTDAAKVFFHEFAREAQAEENKKLAEQALAHNLAALGSITSGSLGSTLSRLKASAQSSAQAFSLAVALGEPADVIAKLEEQKDAAARAYHDVWSRVSRAGAAGMLSGEALQAYQDAMGVIKQIPLDKIQELLPQLEDGGKSLLGTLVDQAAKGTAQYGGIMQTLAGMHTAAMDVIGQSTGVTVAEQIDEFKKLEQQLKGSLTRALATGGDAAGIQANLDMVQRIMGDLPKLEQFAKEEQRLLRESRMLGPGGVRSARALAADEHLAALRAERDALFGGNVADLIKSGAVGAEQLDGPVPPSTEVLRLTHVLDQQVAAMAQMGAVTGSQVELIDRLLVSSQQQAGQMEAAIVDSAHVQGRIIGEHVERVMRDWMSPGGFRTAVSQAIDASMRARP